MVKKKHSWQHLPHPGPDPAKTQTLREIFEKVGDGTLLVVSQGRLAPRPTPRTRLQLADELADLLVHAEVFRRTWWELRPDLRDVFWRLLEPIYAAGGQLKLADLAHPPSPQDLTELEHAGLLFPIPSAVRPTLLAFPYEYFFMPDMPGTGQRSLCQGLRHYSDGGVRQLSTELGMRDALPRAAALAQMHRRLVKAGARLVENLLPPAAQLLEHIALRGGVIAARALGEKIAAANPIWSLKLPMAADDLLGARFHTGSPAQILARRALLIPCGEPGWSAFPQLAIPEEILESACAPKLAKARKSLNDERRRLGKKLPDAAPDSRPGQFVADLRRLALATHLDRPEALKGGRMGKAARKRLETLLHLSDPELDELLEFATRREGAGEVAWGEALEAFLSLTPVEQMRGLADDFMGPVGWRRDFRRHLVDILAVAGTSYVPLEALSKHLAHDPAALSAWETCHAGESGPTEEAWTKQRATADLKTLHRLGFAERASGAAHDCFRLCADSAWALTGKTPPERSSKAPRGAAPAETGFAVLPTLEVLASPAAGLTLLQALSRVARLERADAAFVFRIDRRSLAAGVNSGMTPEEVREFLEKHSRNPLPHTLDTLLLDLGGGVADVVWDSTKCLLKAGDPMVLLKLKRVKWLRTWLIEGAPEGSLRVTPEADGEDLAARLAKEGFVVGRS